MGSQDLVNRDELRVAGPAQRTVCIIATTGDYARVVNKDTADGNLIALEGDGGTL